MNNIANSTFSARFERLRTNIEKTLERAMYGFEAEEVQLHIAIDMVNEGMIESVDQVLS